MVAAMTPFGHVRSMGTTGYPPGRVKVTFRRPPSLAPADDSLNFERRDLITRPTKST